MKNLPVLPICLSIFLIGPCPALAQKAKVGQAVGVSATEVDVRTLTSEYNSGQYVKALERSRLVLSRDPGNLNVHYLLGNIFIKLGRLDNAADEYDYCYQHGIGTRIGEYAREALNAMNAAAAQAAGQQPGTIDRQTADVKASVHEQGAAFLAARRSTLEAEIKHLNDQANAEIEAVPQYVYINKHRQPNPDYPAIVQGIRDDYAAQIQVLQADNDNEEQKIGRFYKGLADSYDHAKPNLQSQVDDGRPGHKLIDPDPNMYVQNFGTSHAQGQASGVELKTRARELPPLPGGNQP